jgi:hypothetical protein
MVQAPGHNLNMFFIEIKRNKLARLTALNIYSQVKYLLRRHDTYHNDIQHNDIQNNDIQNNDTHHNGIQHNIKLNATLHKRSVIMLSVIYAECRKQTHYAECHYAECR